MRLTAITRVTLLLRTVPRASRTTQLLNLTPYWSGRWPQTLEEKEGEPQG